MIGTFLIIIGALLLAGYISKGVSGLITLLLWVLHCLPIPQSLSWTIMFSVEIQSKRPVSKKVIPSTAWLVFDSPVSLAAGPSVFSEPVWSRFIAGLEICQGGLSFSVFLGVQFHFNATPLQWSACCPGKTSCWDHHSSSEDHLVTSVGDNRPLLYWTQHHFSHLPAFVIHWKGICCS